MTDTRVAESLREMGLVEVRPHVWCHPTIYERFDKDFAEAEPLLEEWRKTWDKPK